MKIPAPTFVATGNAGKLREMEELILEIFPECQKLIGRAARNAEETEKTFLGNALIKARALATELRGEGRNDFAVFADDSGLEVDALQGRPGVFSARYAGDHVPSAAHVSKLLDELRKTPLDERTARYQSAVVLLLSVKGEWQEFTAQGSCEGMILVDGVGDSGFGYDPVFYSTDLEMGFGVASQESKNAVSHRRRAFVKVLAALRSAERGKGSV